MSMPTQPKPTDGANDPGAVPYSNSEAAAPLTGHHALTDTDLFGAFSRAFNEIGATATRDRIECDSERALRDKYLRLAAPKPEDAPEPVETPLDQAWGAHRLAGEQA